MISSNFWDSEKQEFVLLLAQSFNGSSIAKHAGEVSNFVPLS
jgi:hypothetical protein